MRAGAKERWMDLMRAARVKGVAFGKGSLSHYAALSAVLLLRINIVYVCARSPFFSTPLAIPNFEIRIVGRPVNYALKMELNLEFLLSHTCDSRTLFHPNIYIHIPSIYTHV